MKMGAQSLIFACLLAIGLYQKNSAELGCLDNSYHLTESFDHKTYHPVDCTCPCGRYQSQGLWTQSRSQCLECRHFHDPKPLIVVNSIKPSPLKRNIALPSARATMNTLIARWKAASRPCTILTNRK